MALLELLNNRNNLRTLILASAAFYAGIGTLATPVVGVASAWIQLGERPGPGEAAGMLLIVIGLALLVERETAGARLSRSKNSPS